jgi:hypothetical protein
VCGKWCLTFPAFPAASQATLHVARREENEV